MAKAHPAKPKYDIGDVVTYRDRHDRVISGTIRRIEANWSGWHKPGQKPFITYAVGHPTYKERRCYVGEDDIQEPGHD